MSRENKDPAFLLYATTWLHSEETNSLTLEQQGAYVRLLCFAWLNGSIPGDPSELQGLLSLRGDDAAFERVWSKLRRHWSAMPGTPGRLTNRRQEHERAERQQKAADMRARGAAGGQQTAKQNSSGMGSRPGSSGAAGGVADGVAEGVADGVAEQQPSTSSTQREKDGRMDGGTSLSQRRGSTDGPSTTTSEPKPAGSILPAVMRGVRHG